MEQQEEPKLDEILYVDPAASAHYQRMYGGIHHDSVHLYFVHSPFCDKMSNNWAVFTQANNNYPTIGIKLLHSREAFEEAVRAIGGLEYMVVDGPPPGTNAESIFIIRKQYRTKGRNGVPDTVQILGTYFVVGDRIMQAPSLEDVFRNRILSITTNVTKFWAKASSLPLFSPATGHTYLPVTAKASAPAGAGNQSRAESLPPGDTASQAPSTTAKPTSKGATPAIRGIEAALHRSLDTAQRYADEYMDENPLVGEPGSFVFKQTSEHIRRQQEQEKAKAQAAAAQAALRLSQSGSAPGSSAPTSAMPTPAPTQPLKLETNIPIRKGGKAASASPLSAGPGKTLKRRKSKVPGTPTGASPTPAP